MRFIGWMGKLVAVAIVAAIVSGMMSYYTMSVFVQETLKQYDVALPAGLPSPQSLAAAWWAEAAGGSGKATEQRSNPPWRSGTAGEPTARSSTEGNEQPFEEEAVAAWSQTGTGDRNQVVLSPEQFMSKRDQMSEEDKNAIFSLLISQLSETELQHISTMLEDGLTAAELEAMGGIVERHLPAEQVAALMRIVGKYE